MARPRKPADQGLTQNIDPDKLRGIAHRLGVIAPDSRTASAMSRIAKAGKQPVEVEPDEDA